MKKFTTFVVVFAAFFAAAPSFALSQLYDKDKKELATNLYSICVTNNKSSQSGANTKQGFIEEHCKCFAMTAANQLSTNKDFVEAYNSKNSEGFSRILNQVAPSINSSCYNTALKKYSGTALDEAQLSKISDKVGLEGVEKTGFINAFVYACVNDGVANGKPKAKSEGFCSCVAESTAKKISSRDVAQFGMQRNTPRTDAALNAASSACSSKLN